MNWLGGKVLENRRWTDTLFSLRVQAPELAFRAGQFVRIALDVDGERVARAFSLVNPPQDPVLEFYGVIVPEGPLSPRLARLRGGDTLQIASNPAGFLVLSEVPEAQTLWLLSTGTGLAPFLSILRTDAPWQRFREVVLVHAVRQAR
jgi:ferredoxin/flavodoxin---NADP+ reductase